MTMSGKVIVKFLTPIHENEIKGETFTLFQSSAAMRNKVVRSDKECSESSSGIQYDEVEQSSAGGAGEEKERWAGASGGDRKSTRLNSSHVLRSRMPSSA